VKIKIIIPASGTGTRFGGETPKQFLKLNGEPLLKRTLTAFDDLEQSDEIAVAIPEGYQNEVKNYGIKKLTHIVTGKQTRAESVYAALKGFTENIYPTQIILVHDGIRPFITPETIKSVAVAAAKHGAAIACSPVTDTIKQVSEGKITATPDRSTLWQAQTPQGFTYEILHRAYATAEAQGYLAQATDDSSLVERLGIPVFVVPSPPTNIKITTPSDLKIAEAFLT
jgi:2-C-methyl-D-erythritol 4-phosphate cytidylyltransferase